MGHPAVEVVMTPTMVKHLYEAARRADIANQKKTKTAEELLVPFFTKLALGMPKPGMGSISSAVSKATGEFKPPSFNLSTVSNPKAPGIRTVKPATSVIDPFGVRPQNAIRKMTPAAVPKGVTGPGPMNVGS